MNVRNEYHVLAGVLLLCLLARVAFIVLFGYTLSVEASGYDEYAVNLVAGHGYTRFADLHSDSDVPPLYSFFLAGVYRVFGRSARAVAAVQIVFDLLTVTLVYLIGRRVFPLTPGPSLTRGEGNWARVGLVAAALTALYPYMLFQNLSVNDTAIFTFLLALATYLAYRTRETTIPLAPKSPPPQGGRGLPRSGLPSPTRGEGPGVRGGAGWAAGVGAVLGLAALTKTLALLLIPLWGLWWWRRLGWRRGVMLTSVVGVLAALVIAPWVARNTTLHGRFVFVSTNGGSNLHQGNNPCSRSYLLDGWDVQWTGDCFEPPPPDLDEVEMDRWHTREALDYLTEDLGRALSLFGVKLLVLWSPTITPHMVPPRMVDQVGQVMQYEQPAFQVARVVHLFYFGPLLVLAAVGLGLAWRRRTEVEVFPLLAVFVAVTFTYVLTHPSTRYRMPLDPLLFIFSAGALVWLWQRVAPTVTSAGRRA